MNGEGEHLSFFDYLGIFLKRRKLVILVILLFLLGGIIFSVRNGSMYVVETRFWSSNPKVSVEFLKSSEILNGSSISREGGPLIEVFLDDQLISLTVSHRNFEQAKNISNILQIGLFDRHEELNKARAAKETEVLEQQIEFFLEKQKDGLILEDIPLSVSGEPADFVYIINTSDPFSQGGILVFIKNVFFALLMGIFFSFLAALAAEYVESTRGRFDEMRRKWLT